MTKDKDYYNFSEALNQDAETRCVDTITQQNTENKKL